MTQTITEQHIRLLIASGMLTKPATEKRRRPDLRSLWRFADTQYQTSIDNQEDEVVYRITAGFAGQPLDLEVTHIEDSRDRDYGGTPISSLPSWGRSRPSLDSRVRQALAKEITRVLPSLPHHLQLKVCAICAA